MHRRVTITILTAALVVAAPSVATISRTGGGGAGDGGLAVRAAIAPRQIAYSNGILYAAQATAIRRVYESGNVDLLAGTYYRRADGVAPPALGQPVPALSTPLNGATAVAVDLSDVYAAVGNEVVVIAAGTLRTILAVGTVRSPNGLAVHGDTLYIADTANGRVMACPIPTMACVPTVVVAGLTFPMGLAFRGDELLIAENAPGNRVRSLVGGVLSTIAGGGFGAGDGPATSVALTQPSAVAVAPDGAVYIAETGRHRVRKLSAGALTTVAGTGQPNMLNNWVACETTCNALTVPITSPVGVAVDDVGRVWIASEADQRLYRLDGGMLTPTGTPTHAATATTTATATRTPTLPPTATATATATKRRTCVYGTPAPLNEPCDG